MNRLKVKNVDSYGIEFEGGVELYSGHSQDCCEVHRLCFEDLTISDFEMLEFDLTDDKFFKRVEGYGIELIPVKGHSVKIAGHGENNGYYSDDLFLVLSKDESVIKEYDITDCQDVVG